MAPHPRGSPLTQGSSALVDMISNIGPIAMGVLVLLLFASLYSWTVILGKMSTFGKATKESRNFIRAFRKATRLQEIAALADDYKASPLAQVFDRGLRDLQAADGRLGTAAQPDSAGALGADGGERSGDQPGTADDLAGDDRGDQPVCGAVRHGDGRCGRVSRAGHGGSGHAAGRGAGHLPRR